MIKFDVSIVIVCMNNLNNLYPCLESIRKYTSVSYEAFVVAYLFSKENLLKVKLDFPWVTFIESNEIRGFSENNNLALKQAKGKYCFVLNDDTYMDMPVIDKLFQIIEGLPKDVACISPKSLFPDGRLQSCGRPPHTFFTTIMGQLKLYNEQHVKSKFVNQPGLFETATVVGAFFLIKTDVFRKIGFFNEKFFFCPEDVEVGIKLRKCGYKCYVDSNVYIYHLDGGTFKVSKLRVATMPAATKGELLLYGSNYLKKIVLILLFKTISFIKYIYRKKKVQEKWDAAYIMAMSHKHVIETIGADLTTKEIFVKFYKEIKK